MRTRFADAAQHADAFFVIRAISIRYCSAPQRIEAERMSRMIPNRHLRPVVALLLLEIPSGSKALFLRAPVLYLFRFQNFLYHIVIVHCNL